VTAAAAGWWQSEQFSADHLLGERWRQGGQLFADDPHLFQVGLVGGELADLVDDRRSDASASGGFAQRGADGIGVGHALGPDHVERCR
jgi:hypothetical protein